MASVLATYLPKTGNMRKVAEAIYGAVSQEKDLKSINEVDDIKAYDFTFAGGLSLITGRFTFGVPVSRTGRHSSMN